MSLDCDAWQGVYMLQDNKHKLLARCSPSSARTASAKQMGALHAKYPAGLIRGALGRAHSGARAGAGRGRAGAGGGGAFHSALHGVIRGVLCGAQRGLTCYGMSQGSGSGQGQG